MHASAAHRGRLIFMLVIALAVAAATVAAFRMGASHALLGMHYHGRHPGHALAMHYFGRMHYHG